jgi:perosamine synthetase
VRSAHRDELRAVLERKGIGTQVHYPLPVHRQPAYQRLRADCHISEKISAEILSLPMHAQLTPGEVQQVCEHIIAHIN